MVQRQSLAGDAENCDVNNGSNSSDGLCFTRQDLVIFPPYLPMSLYLHAGDHHEIIKLHASYVVQRMMQHTRDMSHWKTMNHCMLVHKSLMKV